jgi:hypothetical protein
VYCVGVCALLRSEQTAKRAVAVCVQLPLTFPCRNDLTSVSAPIFLSNVIRNFCSNRSKCYTAGNPFAVEFALKPMCVSGGYNIHYGAVVCNDAVCYINVR